MAYKMHITQRNDLTDGFDVSTLAYNIEHSTSLLAQPGKLTFSLRKDPNPKSEFRIEIGMCVMFWNGDTQVFAGYIFTLSTDRSDVYTVTAYDSMRYLQNHDYKCIGEAEYTLAEIFTDICTALQIPHKVLGKAATENKRLHKHNFIDKSYFEILSECIEDMNVQSIATRVESADGQYIDEEGKRYNEVFTSSDDEKKKIPVKYFVRCNGKGVLELNDIENNVKYRETGIAGGMTTKYHNGMAVTYDQSHAPQIEPLVIGTGSLLTNYKYELDIDKDTYNEVWFMKSQSGNKKKADGKEQPQTEPSGWRDRIKNASATDADIRYAYQQWREDKYTPGPKTLEEFKKLEDSVLKGNGEMNPKGMVAMDKDELHQAKWGLLRKIETVNEGYKEAGLKEFVKLVLDECNRVRKRLSLEALGVDGMNAGDGFVFRLKKLGVEDEMMYIISATHHYGADIHRMSLDVCTPETLTEIL